MKITKKTRTTVLCILSLLLVLTACQKSSLTPGKKDAAADKSQQQLATPFITFSNAPTDSVYIHQDSRVIAFEDNFTVSNVGLVYLKTIVFSLRSDRSVLITKAKVKIGDEPVPSQETITDTGISLVLNKAVPLVGSGPFTLSLSVAGTAPVGSRSQVTLKRTGFYDSLGAKIEDIRNLPQKGYKLNFVAP